MKVTCDVIRDMLPLYHDGICSEDTKKMIEEHLSECSDCREYLKNLDELTGSDPSVIIDSEKAKSNTIKGIKKKIFRKNIIVGLCVFVLSVGVLFGGYSYIMYYETPIQYSDDLIKLDSYDDIMAIGYFAGKDYFGYYGMEKQINKNGQKIRVYYFCYTDTIWTRNFSKRNFKKYNKDELAFVISNQKNDIPDDGTYRYELNEKTTAVYYLAKDYNELDHLNDDEWEKATQDAVLLWEKQDQQ